ncbi:SAM-dependent methyltransferase [Helicobacter sp. 23-1046]
MPNQKNHELQPFSAWMQESLYADKGYYHSTSRVGKDGDFYTSVSASRFFGGSIANFILSLLEQGKLSLPLYIIEIGADKGFLLRDIANFLHSLSYGVMEHTTFATLEPLISLRQSQQNAEIPNFIIYENFAQIQVSIDSRASVFFVSNELFDSFGVDIFEDKTMLFVQNFSLQWLSIPKAQKVLQSHNAFAPQNALLQNLLKQNALDSRNGAISPFLPAFIRDIAKCAKCAKNAYFLTFDYDTHSSLNPRSYIRSYINHQVFSFEDMQKIGLQSFYQCADITADVDFDFVGELFALNGMDRLFYLPQNRALVEKMGITKLLEIFSQHTHNALYLREVAKAKSLLDPQILGERFKCACFCYNNAQN